MTEIKTVLQTSTDFIAYEKAYELQKQLVEARSLGRSEDVILLLQHYPVITIGRGGGWQNILVSSEHLKDQGVTVVESNRGGDITYHGPGQLVGYPILDLRNHGQDLHFYVRQLEEVIIRVLSHYELTAKRMPGMPGVWVDEEKIAAIGIRVNNWITSHGFALNITTDLTKFNLINPCGLGRRVTSMEKLLNQSVSLSEVKTLVGQEFSQVFGMKLEFIAFDQLKGIVDDEGAA